MSTPTFSEAFCVAHDVPPENFVPTVFARTLYPQARPLVCLCRAIDRNFFAADLDLIRATGALRRCRDFPDDVIDFNHHPANQGFLRRTLRIRISTKRLKILLRETLPRMENGDGLNPGT